MKIGDIEVLSLPEAATELGVSHATLRWQVKKGVLKAEKIGQSYGVAREEVERYRAEHLGKRGNYDHTAARRKRADSTTSP